MNTLADFLAPELIKKIAIPSNIRLGTAIAKEGIVEFIEMSPTKVIAKVSVTNRSSKRTVELKANVAGLEYKCTCSNKPNWFCKHCVATSIFYLKIK